MNKKVMFSGVMLLLVLASCGSKDISTSVVEVPEVIVETSMPSDDVVEGQDDAIVFLGQGFAEYDKSIIGETENTVLFFHQESCSTCKATEADLIENGVPSDLQVLKIDIDADSSVELKQKYGVTMKHTFVQVDANGEMIKKWNGSLTGDDIVAQISEDKMMDDTMEKEDNTMVKEEEVMMDKTQEAIQSEEVMRKELSGIYADYDSTLLWDNDTTVLAFFASWCPSCVAADKGISEGEVPSDLSILKVDFDNSTELRQKYGVVAQHTFVQVDADGNEIKKWVGWNSVEDIVKRAQ